MNFSKGSKTFFQSRSMRNFMNSKYSFNVFNCYFNKMTVKSFQSFSNKMFVTNLTSILAKSININSVAVTSLVSGRENIDLEADSDTICNESFINSLSLQKWSNSFLSKI